MAITVVGGGLAGAEAAYQIALRGLDVDLYEMRPITLTPAHKSSDLAELVCSNSFKSRDLTNAHGLLKEELRILGSLIVAAADRTAIAGGKALVVDRSRFAGKLTKMIEQNNRIRVIRQEVTSIPGGTVILASGPLTSPALAEALKGLTGEDQLFFYDAISPIVEGTTIDMEHAFFSSRYAESDTAYLNCPMTAEEYDLFYDELIRASRVPVRPFEDGAYFEGCLPVEVMAERGKQTLLFGPMKPVGIIDPRTGRRPFAVIQLRREDEAGKMFNLVGFQTKLTYPEQERVLRLIPALKTATVLRYGSVHRNTYVKAPAVINRRLQVRGTERVLIAGQLAGVEGYMESTAMGLIAGLSACASVYGEEFTPPPPETATGALIDYITTENNRFQPMNVNFGLIAGYNKREKKAVVDRALDALRQWSSTLALPHPRVSPWDEGPQAGKA
jgi:methylenetetrahydrofolate--tRNA-(uracil-5-)-methyltransferase